MTNPLVSCLCVSRGNNARLLGRALRCFERQTYASRELILVHQGLSVECRGLLDAVTSPWCEIECSKDSPLGELRNVALRHCAGEFFAQWDDDDWHHSLRLERQLAAMAREQNSLCLLSRWIMVNERTHRACIGPRRKWEGSIVCRRSLPIVQAGYLPFRTSEDSQFLHAVTRRYVPTLLDAPELYVYAYHGGNAWSEDHFEALFAQGEPLPVADSVALCDVLRGA